MHTDEPSTPLCRAEHIAVGTEILLGQIVNGHARTISLELASHGLFLYHHGAVGDNLERIVEAFRTAAKRSNVVIVTGGLGPTGDDVTKEALAASLQRKLFLSQEALQELEQFFNKRGKPMPEENRKQAYYIEGGDWVPNPNGTAPGQYVFADDVHYFLLPGPPLEMTPMLKAFVIPQLMAAFPAASKLTSRVLHFCGIGESDVDERIQDLFQRSNPTLAPLAGEGEMLLRITASDEGEQPARTFIDETEQELLRRFPGFVYGFDEETLQSVVASACTDVGLTVAAAESCTGGRIASMLTSVPGSSLFFRGGMVTYHNEVKSSLLGVLPATLATDGAVSAKTACEMAVGVRNACQAQIGISVTGIAGPGGGTPEKPVGLVYGAVCSDEGVRSFKMQFRGSREQIQLRAAKRVLWELWRTLTKAAH